MLIRENVSLKPFNTFGIEAKARFFAEVHSEEDIREIIRDASLRSLPRLILGGGSNILLTGDFEGLVIRNCVKGIRKVSEDDESVVISAGSGEVWHDVVQYCLKHGYGGIENLSLIPGTIGAAPIQNIGAYGVELKESFHSLEAISLESGSKQSFSLEDCRFGYRDSVFKQEAKGRFFITAVSLRLSKHPKLNLSYGAIRQTLEEMQLKDDITIEQVSEAVCRIRSSKLPDPRVIGNAGSFFKNPEIPKARYEALKHDYPAMPAYPAGEGMVKVPAGWLIEACGWKGRRVGETGSHKDQALVLVNYGNATGEEVLRLSKEIQESVWERFHIRIQAEVNVV